MHTLRYTASHPCGFFFYPKAPASITTAVIFSRVDESKLLSWHWQHHALPIELQREPLTADKNSNRRNLLTNSSVLLWPTGKPDQPDPHQVQPDRVNQVPHSHRRVNPVYRWSPAGLHRGLLPPAPFPPQDQRKAHQFGNRYKQRCYRHLPGRSCYCAICAHIHIIHIYLY